MNEWKKSNEKTLGELAMFCRKCGALLENRARFCPRCGAAVEAAESPDVVKDVLVGEEELDGGWSDKTQISQTVSEKNADIVESRVVDEEWEEEMAFSDWQQEGVFSSAETKVPDRRTAGIGKKIAVYFSSVLLAILFFAMLIFFGGLGSVRYLTQQEQISSICREIEIDRLEVEWFASDSQADTLAEYFYLSLSGEERATWTVERIELLLEADCTNKFVYREISRYLNDLMEETGKANIAEDLEEFLWDNRAELREITGVLITSSGISQFKQSIEDALGDSVVEASNLRDENDVAFAAFDVLRSGWFLGLVAFALLGITLILVLLHMGNRIAALPFIFVPMVAVGWLFALAGALTELLPGMFFEADSLPRYILGLVLPEVKIIFLAFGLGTFLVGIIGLAIFFRLNASRKRKEKKDVL